jgi:hypothetical protein
MPESGMLKFASMDLALSLASRPLAGTRDRAAVWDALIR